MCTSGSGVRGQGLVSAFTEARPCFRIAQRYGCTGTCGQGTSVNLVGHRYIVWALLDPRRISLESLDSGEMCTVPSIYLSYTGPSEHTVPANTALSTTIILFRLQTPLLLSMQPSQPSSSSSPTLPPTWPQATIDTSRSDCPLNSNRASPYQYPKPIEALSISSP